MQTANSVDELVKDGFQERQVIYQHALALIACILLVLSVGTDELVEVTFLTVLHLHEVATLLLPLNHYGSLPEEFTYLYNVRMVLQTLSNLELDFGVVHTINVFEWLKNLDAVRWLTLSISNVDFGLMTITEQLTCGKCSLLI